MTTWIKPDWYYPPVAVKSGAQTAVFFEDDGSGSVQGSLTMPVDTYWMINTLPTTPSESYTAFFDELEARLESNSSLSSPTYNITAAETHTDALTPSDTSDRPIGIKVEALDGGTPVDFWWDFADSGFTLPPEYVGFPPDYSQTAKVEVVKTGSPRSNFGRWTPMVRREWDGAARKPIPEPRRRYARSDEDRKRSYNLQIDETRYMRTIVYEDVGATSLRAGRSQITGYPALDNVASGEENNALIDHFDRAEDLDLWLVVLDNDDKTLFAETAGGTEKWETAALDEELDDLSSVWEMTDTHPEQYQLEMRYEIRQSEYDQ